MLYIPKIGDIVKVNRMVVDDPKLLQNNQENVLVFQNYQKKLDVTTQI